MRISHPISRGRRLSLTSLIDVIFLLLLFFMLSSTFSKYAEVEIAGGRSGQASTAQKPGILITLDEENWRVNGERLAGDEAIHTLQALVESEVKTAILLVRNQTTSQQLVSAIERLRTIAGLKLQVAR